MTPQAILDAVDGLDHSRRWRHMIALGRRSLTDRSLADAIASLAASEQHYRRYLALMAAAGSGDATSIAGFLADASGSLAAGAIRLAVLFVPDAALAAAMPGMPRQRRDRLARACAKAGRSRVNDAAYALLDAREQPRLLPATTESFVRACLDAGMADRLTPVDWSRLTRRFPGIVRDGLTRQLDAPGEPSHQVRWAVVAALQQMGKRTPAVGLPLLATAATRLPAYLLPCAAFAAHDPEGVAAIVRANPGPLRGALPLPALRRLDDASLCALADIGAVPELPHLFARLRPGQRAALYRAGGQAWRDRTGALPLALVSALPAGPREAEARHAFTLPLLQANPSVRLPYLACLPFDEALALARPFLSQPEGDLRASAVSAVVGSGRYQPSRLGDILEFCLARENEQDPVRLAMMSALAGLPPTRWTAANLPKVAAVIAAALRARDCSAGTMATAARLLLGLIVTHTGFVVDELPVLVERLGSLNLMPLEQRMSDAQAARLAPRLLPLLESWTARNRHAVAVGLVLSFGRRALAVPAFGRLLAAIAVDSRGPVARLGLEGLARIRHTAMVADLVPKLVADDPSWIQVPEVAQHLHRHRQDLLTPFLTARVLSGRFPSGRAGVLPGFDRGFSAWTAGQQALYAAALAGFLAGEKRNAWELAAAVARIGAMPSADLSPLIGLARLDAADVALRDKALEALGRADAGRGISVVIEALDDARGRVAVYALRRALMLMPADRALAILGRAPRTKVTVAKEIVRLAGELGGEPAFAFLLRVADEPILHPDVRIALLRAFWDHLDRPEVWPHFEAAATGERAALARATIRIPQDRLSPDLRARLGRHLALLLRHPDPQVRRETLQRLVDMPLGGHIPALRAAMAALLADADSDVVQLAARALLGAHARDDAEALAATFAAVTRPPALAAIVAAYGQSRQRGAAGLEASAQALIAILFDRRWHAPLALRLALSILEPDAALATLKTCAEAGLLHPGAVGAALDAMPGMTANRPSEALPAIERTLRLALQPGLRRIGLGLLGALATKRGWTEEERAGLMAYRADADAWVSDAADLVEPPESLG
ncbi:hypothetical protein [Labrys wisconsinensis]|uniref:HEAT repeat domain-containing protein n=1 Tax=Labrys wisconsinensis TaxID=425677 RepID=A0ABU0J7G1_9HYPH|nr:hypothetical protein [Labrys wisconsinensis]MDQ0469393.1 hypothetical protein [Labrys wisconsinensis]